jgi:hypothetical protein
MAAGSILDPSRSSVNLKEGAKIAADSKKLVLTRFARVDILLALLEIPGF